jgi:hypothetical protein
MLRTATIFLMLLAYSAAEAAEQFSGCWPITIQDAAAYDAPTFERHRTSEKYDGPPASVDFGSHPRARTFRTMLRLGAKKGPNFAGHFTIVGWGCGASCLDFAIVDAKNGQVWFPQFRGISAAHLDTATGEPEPNYLQLRFERDSSLLVVLGALNDDQTAEGIFYFKWDGKQLQLLRRLMSKKEDCENAG